ncbi:MAG: DNA polymerase Y family protein, partial [Rubrivivax sp.]|nr:DNA polymerase Y family protein [Rubrivivax sp.]
LASSALPHHRPAWLLPEPLPLAERGALPLLEGGPLQLVSGPERIEAGWWDGTPAVRDYFIAQAEDGSLVWVYRGRLPAAAGDAGWFLQGRFA